MDANRFDRLYRRLLWSGVSMRHARRACRELSEHCDQLTSDAFDQGASPDDAVAIAHRQLGEDDTIVAQFAAQLELRALPCRWPRLTFLLLPFVTIVCWLVGGALFFDAIHLYRQLPSLPDSGLQFVCSLMNVVMAWGLPLLAGLPFVWIAGIYRLPWYWPTMASLVVGVFSSMAYYDAHLLPPGSEGRAEVTIGFGLHLPTWYLYLLHALGIAFLLLTPMLIRHYRWRQPVPETAGESEPANQPLET